MRDITSLLVLAALGGLLGIILLWRGWRGRRMGEHPYCRRCEFNLFGSTSQTHVCPECGADLSVPRAIVIGVRQRRPAIAAIGAVLLLPAMLILGTILMGTMAGVDWNKRLPPWALARQATSPDTLTRDAALAELNSRLTAAMLSMPQIHSVAETGLKYQAQADRPWSVGWGDFIEAAEKAGQLSEDQSVRYAKQAVTGATFKLTLRPRMHADEPIGYSLQTVGGDRVGKGSRLYKVTQINGLTLGGADLPAEAGSGILTAMLSASGATSVLSSGRTALVNAAAAATPRQTILNTSGRPGAAARGILVLDPAQISQLGPGIHRGEARIAVKVTPNRPRPVNTSYTIPANTDPANLGLVQRQFRNRMEVEAFRQAQPLLAQTEVKIPVTVEIVPADQPTIVRVDDEKLRSAVENSIMVQRVRMLGARLDVSMSCTNPPTDLAYNVIVRQGEKEWSAGTMVVSSGGTYRPVSTITMSGGLIMPNEAPSGTKVDVVLRPDPSGALANPEINSYWGGEIVLRDVPFQGMRGGVALESSFADAINTFRPAVPGLIVPGPIAAGPIATGEGVLLRIDIRPLQGGNGPSTMREMIVHPRIPFLQRFTDEQGATTSISGLLSPGSDASQYQLSLTYETQTSGGAKTVRETLGGTRTMNLGQPTVLRGSTTTLKTVTLKRPE